MVTRNSLLNAPPEQYHKLNTTSRFRQVMGRAPRESDYHGVHTTDSLPVAAAYAISAWRLRGEQPDDYPVVIRLRTEGLEPLADVDAMLQGMEVFDANRRSIAEQLRDGESIEKIERSYDDASIESDLSELVGLDPAEVVFDDIMRSAPNLVTILLEHGGEEALRKFAEGEAQPPDRALSEIVRQRRYMNDFDLDRVAGIDAIRPWWAEIVNEDEEDAIDKIVAAGWEPVTFEDAASGWIEPVTKTIWGAVSGGEHDYHGTTAGVARAAFPGITLGEGFPPVTPHDEVDVTARGEDVDDEDEAD